MVANSSFLYNQTTGRGNTTAKPNELEVCPGLSNAAFKTLDSSVPYFVNAVLNVTLAIATTFANLMVLLGMRHVTSIRLPSKLLLCSLVLTDLGTGSVLQPQFAALLLTKAIDPRLLKCVLVMSVGFTSSFFISVSFLMLTVISLDRYTALFFPLKYQQFVTTRRVCVVLAVIWSFSLFAASRSFGNDRTWRALALTITVVNFSVMSVLCIKIYRRLRAHQVQPQAPDQAQQQAGNTLNMERYRRTASAMMWVYVLFLVCYVPYLCSSLVVSAVGYTPLTAYLRGFSYTLVLVNSLLNPFVYCLRLLEIRTEVTETAAKTKLPNLTLTKISHPRGIR